MIPKILECPDCKNKIENTAKKDPSKELIKCPKCGEFMYNEDPRHSLAVKAAMGLLGKDTAFSGGFDIMKKLVKKQRKHQDIKKEAILL